MQTIETMYLLSIMIISYKFPRVKQATKTEKNEEYRWCKQFSNNADTLCFESFLKCDLIEFDKNATLLEVMLDCVQVLIL